MRFVHKQAIYAQFLKGHGIVFLLVVQLFEL